LHTFCYKESDDPKEVCPITDIQFLGNDFNATYYAENNYEVVDFNENYKLAWSKTIESRPLTSMHIGPQPCYDPA